MEETGKNYYLIAFVSLLVFLMVGNLLFLDWQLLFSQRLTKERLATLEKRVDSLIKREVQMGGQEEEREEVAVSEEGEESLVEPTPTPIVERVVEKQTVVEKQVPFSQVKEYYVPLGSTKLKTTNYQWADTGLEVSLDFGNYGAVRQANFEAILSMPEGRMEVRLMNVTEGYGIWESTLACDKWTAARYTSSNLPLVSGSKIYRVQVRTSLEVEGVIDSAAIKILVE